ncbi:AMP-binding protein [Pasteurellaceae bacterium RH1A]|nr:AMP-binding protein [Pasteurellaceae bacterium RH1A]
MKKEPLIARNPDWHLSDFLARSAQIASQLQQDGVKSVAFWFEDAAYFACTLLACFQAKVRVLLPPNLLAENQDWIAQNADFLFDDKRFESYGLLQEICQIPPLVEQNNDTEIWLKTSGSSGEPKILVKTAKSMWLESEAIRQSLPFEAGNHIHLVSSVSAQHHYGLSYRIFLPLTMGWSIARKQLPYPEHLIAETLSAAKAVWISSPALLTHLNLKEAKLQQCCFEGMISSGGALPVDTANALRAALKIPVIECYGSTETGAIAFRADDGFWTPTPLTQLSQNEQGALRVQSAWLDQIEQTADAVEFVGNQFHLLGRIDRIVKFGDKRISLVKIEQDLLKHPWVSDCYIAQHPEHARPAAWVALHTEGLTVYQTQGRNAVINQLRQFLITSQEHSGLPRFWRFTHQLPRNSQSKLSRLDFEAVFKQEQGEINV